MVFCSKAFIRFWKTVMECLRSIEVKGWMRTQCCAPLKVWKFVATFCWVVWLSFYDDFTQRAQRLCVKINGSPTNWLICLRFYRQNNVVGGTNQVF